MIDFESHISRVAKGREPKGLYEPIAYTLDAGGKRVRPQLLLCACRMFGGRDEQVIDIAMAFEVFHNFTLLHDDVMDKADMRRGRATVHRKWDEKTAILSGDQMMIEAYKLIVGSVEKRQISVEAIVQVLRWFLEMATEICEGQQYDVDFERREDVTIEEYIEMIRLKTSVLLANALRTGAYLGGADTKQQQIIYDCGIHLGLAFQIQDDLLDVYGDPQTFGKAIGGDICCNKKTYLLLSARDRANREQRQRLGCLLDEPAGTEKVAKMTELYNEIGAREVAQDAISLHTEEALRLMGTLPQNKETERLMALTDKLAGRKV